MRCAFGAKVWRCPETLNRTEPSPSHRRFGQPPADCGGINPRPSHPCAASRAVTPCAGLPRSQLQLPNGSAPGVQPEHSSRGTVAVQSAVHGCSGLPSSAPLIFRGPTNCALAGTEVGPCPEG